MTKPQTPNDYNDETARDKIAKRVDGLFSGQEPPSFESLREVEAMKARLKELEAQLATQPASQPSHASTIPDKPGAHQQPYPEARFPHWSASKASPSDGDNRVQNASRVLTLLFGAIVLSLPVYVYWAVKTGAWQIYAIIASLICASIFLGLAISLARRNRVEFAMELMVANTCLMIPFLVGLITGMGVVAAATQFLIILAIVGQSLTGPRAVRSLLLGFVSSIVTILIDLTAPWTRFSVPGLQSTLPVTAGIVMIALGFLVARQFRNYSLRSKLIVTFVAVALVSTIAVGYVTNRVATAQFNAELGANFNELAARMGRETSDSLLANKLALDGLVLNKFVQDSVEQANRYGTDDLSVLENFDKRWVLATENDPLIRQILANDVAGELRELQERLPQYSELFVTDQYGAIIASTNRTSDYYQADEVWWQSAWNDGKGDVFISEPEFDESAGVYAIDIALPIPAHTRSDFVGVLRATVNINELTGLLASSQFGRTGEAVLVFPSQQFLTRQLGAGLSTLDPETLSEVSAMEGAYTTFVYEGTPSLVSKAPVASIRNSQDSDVINRLGWTIVIHQDLVEANQPITSTTRGITFTAIGVLIAAGLLALFVGGQFAKPIENLTFVASQIAAGDLLAEANDTSRDEIGTLAKTFNRMTFQLRETLMGLEQRVAERTHDLELASEVGRTISEKVGNLAEMLNDAAETIRSNFDLYYTQVYLVDSSGRSLILRAGTGEAGIQLLERGHRLSISASSLNSRAASGRQPVLVGDTHKSAHFLPNSLLPLTRSELSVPLIANEQVVGVLDMQSERPETFSAANLAAFQVLAGQLAIAIQNSLLFHQTEEARLQVEEQARRLTTTGWEEFLDAVDRSEKVGYVFRQEEVLPLVEASSPASDNTLVVPIQVTGAKIGEIQLTDEVTRRWTSSEMEMIQAAMSHVAGHIEGLRLLAQAERYRAQAEQVSRRLTRQGWNEYLGTRRSLADGYAYDSNTVEALSVHDHANSAPELLEPITVREEVIGTLAMEQAPGTGAEARQIMNAVAKQLSEHIENLRLLEQSQERTFELEEAQVFLDSVIESLPHMLFVKDAEDLRFLRWNKAAEELVGYSQDVMLGKNDYDFFSKEEADFFTSKDRQVLADGKTLDIPEESLVTVHHGTRIMHTRKAPVYGADGKPKYLLGVAEDITEHKQASEALARRATELATVAQVSTTASTVLDPDLLLQAVVDLTKEQFGLYHAHIYLANESWNTLLLAAGSGEVGRKLVAEEHAIPMSLEQSLVARAARQRSSIIVNDVRSEPGFLPNPMLPETLAEMAVPMIVGNTLLGVFDVQSNNLQGFSSEDAHIFTTLAAQVAVALQNARLYVEQSATVTQLRELDRLKSSFLANMSHELRTPLNSILGFTDVMLEGLDGDLTDYMDNDLRLIQKNGQHLLHLINDVLDMAKIESGRMNLHPETFKLHSVLDEVTSITSTLASEKNLSLFIDENSDQEIEVYADNTRLRQVVINLVNNSIKFTEKGKIILSASPMEGARVLISVKDTGIGIPPDKLEAIFQEFTQVDTSTTRKAGGTGLGLPISRRLVEMHGGRLWAESTGVEGEGSIFHVELPVEARITEVIEKQEK